MAGGLNRREALGLGAAAGGAALLPAGPAIAGPPPPAAVHQAVCAYVASAAHATLPAPVAQMARLHILDTLAAIVACRDLAAAEVGRRYARGQSSGARRNAATILGTRERAALVDAVFAGAMAGHAAEINDFIPSALAQPGPAVVSTAFGLAEARGLSGRAVLNAVVAGYELTGRIPKAIGVANLQRQPLATHGVGPVFGSAAAATSLLGFDERQVGDVLSACAQQASGSWQWALDVRHVEKAFTFAGIGARNGLQAALLVEAGYTGIPASLDAPGGWIMSPAFTGLDADRASLAQGLGTRFELSEAAYKRYPCGGPTQPAVEGVLRLLPQLSGQQIERVTIEMPGRAATFQSAAMPALNLPYLVSLILIDGRLDFTAAQSLDRMVQDQAVRALAARVSVRHDPAQEARPGEPRPESARVTIATDQRTSTIFVPYVRGYPSHPMSREEVEEKATGLLAPTIGDAGTREVIARIAALEEERGLSSIIRLLAR